MKTDILLISMYYNKWDCQGNKGIKEQLTVNCQLFAGKDSATTKSGKRIDGKREKNTATTKHKGAMKKKHRMKVAVISSPLTKK